MYFQVCFLLICRTNSFAVRFVFCQVKFRLSIDNPSLFSYRITLSFLCNFPRDLGTHCCLLVVKSAHTHTHTHIYNISPLLHNVALFILSMSGLLILVNITYCRREYINLLGKQTSIQITKIVLYYFALLKVIKVLSKAKLRIAKVLQRRNRQN